MLHALTRMFASCLICLTVNCLASPGSRNVAAADKRTYGAAREARLGKELNLRAGQQVT